MDVGQEGTVEGGDAGGLGSSRSPRVTPHDTPRLAAYLPEWEVGFEPRLLHTRSISSRESEEMFEHPSRGVEL